jgi:N-acetylneuraminate synthase
MNSATPQESPQCFVIAEAGVNHNGDTDTALKLVDAAADAGADAVKFQTFKAETLVRPGAAKAEYQRRATGDGDQFSMLKQLEMSDEMHRAVIQRCEERAIEFMSTPFDLASARYLHDLGMRRIKIPSGEINNIPLLRELARFGHALILSTGMADLDEVSEAVGAIRAVAGEDCDLTVLHCTSNYPADFADLNLRAMRTIEARLQVSVGYSDHSPGIAVPIAAVALGARVVEKHFTLDRAMAGPDHKASLTVMELAEMVRMIRQTEAALGSPEKKPADSELPIRRLVRKSVTLVRPIAAGVRLVAEDLALLRPADGLPPAMLEQTIGRKVARDLPAGTSLTKDDLA